MKRILLLLIILISCSGEPSPTIDQITQSGLREDNYIDTKGIYLSNPSSMYGRDFLSFFKILRKIGNIDEMILFTSSESFKIFGKKKLKDIYENSFDGKSDFKMIKIIKVNEKHFIMYYLNSDVKTKFQINVVNENDSIKLIFENNYPFKN